MSAEEDYKQLLNGYPNANHFFNGAKKSIESRIPSPRVVDDMIMTRDMFTKPNEMTPDERKARMAQILRGER